MTARLERLCHRWTLPVNLTSGPSWRPALKSQLPVSIWGRSLWFHIPFNLDSILLGKCVKLQCPGIFLMYLLIFFRKYFLKYFCIFYTLLHEHSISVRGSQIWNRVLCGSWDCGDDGFYFSRVLSVIIWIHSYIHLIPTNLSLVTDVLVRKRAHT